jgi:hypothetical protein
MRFDALGQIQRIHRSYFAGARSAGRGCEARIVPLCSLCDTAIFFPSGEIPEGKLLLLSASELPQLSLWCPAHARSTKELEP